MSMKKKGRGSSKKRKRVKKFEEHCPFWLFTLFVVSWSGVFFLVVALFYVALLKPAYQFIPIASEARPSYSARVDRGFELIDEMMDEMMDEGMVEEASPFQSCRPLDATDVEASAIEDWLGADRLLRGLGDRCVMDGGRILVTFAYNDIVPFSERPYLQHGVGVVDGGFQADTFYCRTSPRGEPASITASNGKIELQCAFQAGDDGIVRTIVLGEDLRVDAAATLNHPGNGAGYRLDTGDHAREYCVSLVQDAMDKVYGRFTIAGEGSVCRLRNGVIVIANSGARLYVLGSTGELRGSWDGLLSDSLQPVVIGSEGSFVDIAGTSEQGEATILRVDIRSLNGDELYRSGG